MDGNLEVVVRRWVIDYECLSFRVIFYFIGMWE